MLAINCNFNGEPHKAGDMVRMPYGSALQLCAVGAIRAIENAEDQHILALENLSVYGPDSWFAPHVQTLGKLREAIEAGNAKQNAPSSDAVN